MSTNEKEFAVFASKLYALWFEAFPNITLAEMLIINRVCLYYDKGLKCGHKELSADLCISQSTISKYLKKGIKAGIIYSQKANDDRRRSYFYPLNEVLERRATNFKRLMDIK